MTIGGWRGRIEHQGDTLAAILVAAATLVALTATSRDFGMTWDEGFTIEREERLGEWFARIAGDDSNRSRAWVPKLSKLQTRTDYLRRAGETAASPWSRESLRFYWQFAREEPNGHPPFYALIGLAGWAVTHRVLPPLEAYRFGPQALFAFTVGVLWWDMARRYGRIASAMAVLGLLTMPRMFAHAHLASYDVPTLCFWYLSVVAFLRAIEPGESKRKPWAWSVALGIAWGCGAATKLTGWFIPLPLIAWILFYREWRAFRVLAAGALTAALVMYVTTPTWWAEPISGARIFLVTNMSRDKLLPIPTYFLGRLYLYALPWYNTLVWTAVVVPPITLALALLGAGHVIFGRFRDRAGTMLLGCWAFFLIVRALPSAPGHDGERLFLPAFVFLACLAGVGLARLGAGLGRIAAPKVARAITATILIGAVGAGTWSTWAYHPLQLSYYNSLIGGLSGATKAGLEPTYYWDAVTPDVRAWLNEHTDDRDSVGFAFAAITFEYLHHWGLLRASPLTKVGTGPRWFVVMNRPGHLLYPSRTLGKDLLDHYRPVFVKTLDVAPEVPLIAIFSGEDAVEADRILRASRSGGRDVPETRPPAAPQP